MFVVFYTYFICSSQRMYKDVGLATESIFLLKKTKEFPHTNFLEARILRRPVPPADRVERLALK